MKRILFAGIVISVLGAVAVGWMIEAHFPAQSAVFTAMHRYLLRNELPPQAYSYYVLKQSEGFVLARAQRGGQGQPLSAPQAVTPLGNSFGLAGSDSISALYLSPDGNYLAVNGNSDHGELIWIYNTQTQEMRMVPQGVAGNFLRWLPGGHSFLYRPMLPIEPEVTEADGTWNPGLWVVDAASGEHRNIDIGVPAAQLIDAAPSPDGARIIYSTTEGLGQGSDVYLMQRDGRQRELLFALDDDGAGAQSIAGLFAWSPDGQHIAYERLADSSTPFLAAGLWVMNVRSGEQQRLGDADGGHGFSLSWSPDNHRVAFIARTNFDEHQADFQTQALQSGVGVADILTHHTWLLASTSQTGVQWNINPSWEAGGTQLTFAALNPINEVLGGTPRYWSVPVLEPGSRANPVPLTPSFQHIVAIFQAP